MAKQDNAPGGESSGKPDSPTGQAGSPGEGVGAQGSAAGQASSAPASSAQTTDAIALLKADHRKVEGLFAKYETATSGKDEIVRQICMELTVHTALEEEIFYPACRRAASDEEPLDEAQVEHDSAKMLIADLSNSSDRDRFRDAKVSVLSEQIKHHVGEEEAPSRGIFAKAQSAGVNTPELAKKLQERKQELTAEPDRLPPSRPVSFQLFRFQTGRTKEDNMASYRSERDRDERGRFTDDDDRGRYGARGGRDRDDDDDRRGWYGDPRGHSEASRRGWEEHRGESRSFRRDDDDDRRYARERDERGRFTDDDDDRRYSSRSSDRDRDERGRFMDDDDDRRYSSRGASRDRDDRGRYADDDRRSGEGRGWYGDSRGHAEASRRGWEERDNSRRSRDDDDDRRGGRGGSQGGWFGDSRGHAEAARRGWQDRR
ncbi:hemerythrin domain-containing protein [Phenylobacterium sp.]|jgi:hypothetical protein|uniref:hemerythrin domain-containing protein n=1 Tax=Phenylobacterium sp. TaxID=1871053 RepID=UPI002E350E4A|nr:hemerythrin domain-containing protein [Phenylobacterium sp.]HEX4710848.1 hemerythrin domain-containing protein [Phenylobacterium sp.]